MRWIILVLGLAGSPLWADQAKICDIAIRQAELTDEFSKYAEARANSVRSAAISSAISGNHSPMFRKTGDAVSDAVSKEANKVRITTQKNRALLAEYCN